MALSSCYCPSDTCIIITDIRHTELKDELKDRGTLFYHGRDKDSKRLLVFRVRSHTKSKELMEEMKKFVHYQLERLERYRKWKKNPWLIYLSHMQLFREENGDPVSLMFELDGCGLKNMDMEFIQYLIGVFRDFSPFSLNYILVYEMPWVLNGMSIFKIIFET